MKKPQLKRKKPAGKKKTPQAVPHSKKNKIAGPVIKNILVPVDFSEYSLKALRYAASYASISKAAIHLLHVIEPIIYPSDFAIGQLTFPNIENELREKAEMELLNLSKSDILRGIPVTTGIKDGIPFVESIAYAKDEKIDLIIISTHGRTGVEHILFGSTAEKIVRKAPCPVLVVRSDNNGFVDERV